MLCDPFGRPFTYARISLTDRCQLRCTYCMPAMLQLAPREDILTYEELLFVVDELVALGVEKIRFTGGEPLLRRGVEGFLTRVRALHPHLSLALTTNALLLSRYVELLRDLKVSVNVSLDTLRRETFLRLTGVDLLDEVLRGIERARKVGLPFKLNTVLLRGVNEDELVDLVRFARDLEVPIRFIEYMPVSTARDFRARFLSEAEARTRLAEHLDLVPDGTTPTARMFRDRKDPRIRVGFISTVSAPFCEGCTRLRLTATGKLVRCLFDPEGVDLMPALRPQPDPQAFRRVLEQAVATRPPGFVALKEIFEQTGRISTEERPFSMRNLGG